MVALYTYRLDQHKGLELRYSIRSMVKYFTALTDILLVGDKPDWYKGDHIPCEDIKDKPGLSIAKKIIASGINDDFLWCADDHFALKPFGADLPNYYTKPGKQVDASIRKMLSRCPQNWLNYIVHCPMIINGAKFREAMVETNGKEYPIKTFYANWFSLQGTYLDDLKFRGIDKYSDIKKRIEGRPFFATSESAMGVDMIKVMEELYPEASNHE